MRMMIMILAAATLSSGAHAASQLTCWNTFSKQGSTPIMKAEFNQDLKLKKVQFNFKDEYFESYFFDKTEDSGEQWKHKPAYKKSSLTNPEGVLKPENIKGNVYDGDNAYKFDWGKWSLFAPYTRDHGTYSAKLVLPPDLSPNFLKTFRIRSNSERSNAVLIMSPPYLSDQEGQAYLRMFCSSK